MPRRILAITSINQLFIGQASMKSLSNKNHEDYLFINNLMIDDEYFDAIQKYARLYNFKKVIDCRPLIKKLSFSKNESFFKKAIRLINQKKYQRIASRKIIELLGFQNVDQIFCRYKINTPEKLIIDTFPRAPIYLYEDGIGDYIKINKFQKKLNPINRIKNFIKFFLLSFFLKKIDKNLPIEKAFHLIDIKNSSRKENINFNWNNSIPIKNEYLLEMEKVRNMYFKSKQYSESALLLTSAFSTKGIWYQGRSLPISDDIIFTQKIIKNFMRIHPNKKLYLKPHHRSSSKLLEALKKEFPGNILPKETFYLPAECILSSENFSCIVSSMFSSTLLYGKYLLNKDTYFASIPKRANILYPDYILSSVVNQLNNNDIKNIFKAN